MYQNHAFLFCACDEADKIVEIDLTEPNTCKQLCRIPEPSRTKFAVVAFGHKVLIFGGRRTVDNHLLDFVLEFDIHTKKFKAMPRLPYAVELAASIRWGDQAVLMGGFGKNGQSRKVLLYDSKTGETTELPSMLQERVGCAAIITGNTIVVMGGKGKSKRVNSVEAFTLGSYSWRSLPAMNNIRSGATATIIPTKKFK